MITEIMLFAMKCETSNQTFQSHVQLPKLNTEILTVQCYQCYSVCDIVQKCCMLSQVQSTAHEPSFTAITTSNNEVLSKVLPEP